MKRLLILTATVIAMQCPLPVLSADSKKLQNLMEDAKVLANEHQPDSALAKARQALATIETEDSTYASVLFFIGKCHFKFQHYDSAAACFGKTLAINERLFGPDHLQVAKSLDMLANLADMHGHRKLADSLFKRTLAILQSQLEPGDRAIGKCLYGMGLLAMNQYEYGRAEELLREAQGIFDGIPDLQPDYSTHTRNSLVLVYMWQHKYDKAEKLLRVLIDGTEKKYGPNSPYLLSSLNHLALILSVYGRIEEAEPIIKRAINITTITYGPNSPYLTESLLTLAGHYVRQKKYQEAVPYYERYLDIQRKAKGENHPDVASGMVELAGVYLHLGDTAAVAPLFEQSLNIYERTVQSDSLGGAYRLEVFAYYFCGYAPKKCMQIARHTFDIRRKILGTNTQYLSEQDALRFNGFLRHSAAIYLRCYLGTSDSAIKANEHPEDVILTSKGQISDVMFERNQALVDETDSTSLILSAQLQEVRSAMSQLFVDGPGEDGNEAYRDKLDSLAEIRLDLEERLAATSSSFDRTCERQLIDRSTLMSLLPPGSVLIEYLRWYCPQDHPDDRQPMYLATLLKPNGTSQLIDLGPAEPIDSLIDEYRDHMLTAAGSGAIGTTKNNDYRRIASHLYDKVWRPIKEYLQKSSLVLIAPDGPLNLVAFGGLVDPDGRYLTETHLLHYLSSGRDLIRLAEPGSSGEGLLIMGDPDFDADAKSRSKNEKTPPRSQAVDDLIPPGKTYSLLRDAPKRYRSISEITVDRLPGTAREVETIRQLWAESSNEPIEMFTDAQASEDNFNAKVSGKRVVHLATHGFFIPSHLPVDSTDEQSIETDNSSINPLLLSGLLLAGSNLHGKGCKEHSVDDGVLTADEVSMVDLSGVERVILSACESGLGKVETGEGVYGLRRAFLLAGARTVISSLWPVSDRATAEFMADLYRDSGKPLCETIRDYQIRQIRKMRDAGYSDHPVKWAAFIAIGEWRKNLSH